MNSKNNYSAQTINLFIKGARFDSTGEYVITPRMGDGKKGPVERWFMRKHLVSPKAIVNGVHMGVPIKALKLRKIKPTEYTVV